MRCATRNHFLLPRTASPLAAAAALSDFTFYLIPVCALLWIAAAPNRIACTALVGASAACGILRAVSLQCARTGHRAAPSTGHTRSNHLLARAQVAFKLLHTSAALRFCTAEPFVPRRFKSSHLEAALMPGYGSPYSPSLVKMDHSRAYGRKRMSLGNILGDPFSLATISIALVCR